MQPENMPYFRGPRITKPPADTDDTTNAAHCQAIYSSVMINNCFGLCHLSPMSRLSLANLSKHRHQRHVPCITMSSHVTLSRSSSSVGQYTPSTEAILRQLFSHHGTCHSMFDWHATHMNPADHSSRNSPHADTSSAVPPIF